MTLCRVVNNEILYKTLCGKKKKAFELITPIKFRTDWKVKGMGVN